MATGVPLEPMSVEFDPATIDDLRERLSRTRRVGNGDDDWSRGVPGSWLTDVLAGWRDFDIPGLERRLNAFTHVRAVLDDQLVHVLVAEGHGPNPLPLLLSNGWPSSFCEYLELIPLLTDPGAHGGDPADSFTVVAPALPGYGFSSAPPPGGMSRVDVAHLWDRIMTQGFGHERYVAHGSDIGGGVVAQLARLHPDTVAAIHLATPNLPPPPKPWSAAEGEFFAANDAWLAEQGSYAHQHSTKPATVGVALNDSPAGLAAWIGEKFVAWSSVDGNGQPAFARDLLLATLTLYWVTGTITTSMLPYWKHRHTSAVDLVAGDPSPVPTTVSVFGGEVVPFPKPPHDLATRFYNVRAYESHDRGGHFPAAAEPALLAQILRDAFRSVR